MLNEAYEYAVQEVQELEAEIERLRAENERLRAENTLLAKREEWARTALSEIWRAMYGTKSAAR